MQYLDAISETTEWSLLVSKANHSISRWFKPMTQSVNWKSWTWMILWRSTRLFRTNAQKICPFHYRRLECKSRKSRNTWCNRQIWPWSMEWSRAKANRVLPRECTGYSKHPHLYLWPLSFNSSSYCSGKHKFELSFYEFVLKVVRLDEMNLVEGRG